MCGRFTLTAPDPGQLVKAFSLTPSPDVPALPPRYNVAPSQTIATVVRDAEGHNHLTPMHWGLIPSWAKDTKSAAKMINARSESAAEKPAFRVALSKRRCIIPADGFFEWRKNEDGTKTPMYITLNDHPLFGFAGLWERWIDPESGEPILSCTIMTTEPNALMQSIHNRMPVILPPDAYTEWLDPAQTDGRKAAGLLVQFPAERMTAFPVSARVNNVRADDPSLIQRAAS